MFKYISEILSKFTQSQRIFALMLLLVSVIFISIGPKIVETLTYNDEDLKSRIESQTTQITELNSRLTELNGQIIFNQRQCTDAIVEREKEIMNEIVNLESRIKKTSTISLKKVNAMRETSPNIYSDTVVLMMSAAPEYVETIEKEKTQPNQMMLDGLNKIKRNLNNSINSKKEN